MSNNYEGDPKMIITSEGADFVYNDGQPIMDQGLENNALMSLFTAPGWAGNLFLQPDSQVGSDFESMATGSITLSKLAQIKNSADLALSDSQQVVDSGVVTVENSQGNKIDVALHLSPVSDEVSVLLSSEAGLNWQAQALNPAYKKV